MDIGSTSAALAIANAVSFLRQKMQTEGHSHTFLRLGMAAAWSGPKWKPIAKHASSLILNRFTKSSDKICDATKRYPGIPGIPGLRPVSIFFTARPCPNKIQTSVPQPQFRVGDLWKFHQSSWLFNHGILVVNFFNEINIHITRLCNIPPKKPSPGGPFFGSIVKRQYQKKVMICAKCDHPIGQLMLLLCHKGEKKNSAGDGASFDSRHQTSSNTVYQYWLITSSYSYQNVDMYAWLKHKFRGLVLLEVFLNKWTVQTYAMKSNRNHIESPNFADPPQSCGRGSLLWSCSFVQQKIAQDSGICKLNHIYLESLLPKYEVQSVYSQLYSGLNQNELN